MQTAVIRCDNQYVCMSVWLSVSSSVCVVLTNYCTTKKYADSCHTPDETINMSVCLSVSPAVCVVLTNSCITTKYVDSCHTPGETINMSVFQSVILQVRRTTMSVCEKFLSSKHTLAPTRSIQAAVKLQLRLLSVCLICHNSGEVDNYIRP